MRNGEKRGVGRPKGGNTTAISLRVRNDLLVYVRTKDNASKFINDCIEEHKKRAKE